MSSCDLVASAQVDGISGGRWMNCLRLGLLAILAAAVVGPLIAIAFEALRNAEIRAILADRPLVAAQLVIALVFWISLFGWPLWRLAKAMKRAQIVTISGDLVSCERSIGLRSDTWSIPLRSFTGLAHRVRTTYARTEHAIVLEHPDARFSVSLLVAEHILPREIERLSTALELPILRSQTPGNPSNTEAIWPHSRSEALTYAA